MDDLLRCHLVSLFAHLDRIGDLTGGLADLHSWRDFDLDLIKDPELRHSVDEAFRHFHAVGGRLDLVA